MADLQDVVQALEKNANSQELATKNENTCRVRIISYITLCQKSYFCPKIEFWRNIRTFRPKNRDFDQKNVIFKKFETFQTISASNGFYNLRIWKIREFGKSENLKNLRIWKQFLNNFQKSWKQTGCNCNRDFRSVPKFAKKCKKSRIFCMKITGNKWGKYGCKFSIYKNIFSTIFFANFGANQKSN